MTAVTHAITIRQPYAACVAIGRKAVENRGRPTNHRGPVAIHAGKTISREGNRDPRVTALYGQDPSVTMPLGVVVAVARLVDCHLAADSRPGRQCCQPWGDATYNNGDCYHLVLADAVILDQRVPALGALRVPWEMPADVAEQVSAEYELAVNR